MKIHFGDQKTGDWFKLRLGKATGSEIACLYARGGVARSTYAARLAQERLGVIRPRFEGTEAMRRGNELEPKARLAYEIATGTEVKTCSFIEHDELSAGGSPDFYVQSVSVSLNSGQTTGDRKWVVGDIVLIGEIKCPNSATHMSWLLADEVPDKHKPQICHNLWITGAEWCDFVSYDDRVDVDDCLFIKRVNREAFSIDRHEQLIREFLEEVDERYEKASQEAGREFMEMMEKSVWGEEVPF